MSDTARQRLGKTLPRRRIDRRILHLARYGGFDRPRARRDARQALQRFGRLHIADAVGHHIDENGNGSRLAQPPQRQSRMLARSLIRIAKSPDKDDVGAGRLRHGGDREYGATPNVDVVGLGARAQPGDDVAVRASERPLQGSGDVWIRFGQDRSNQQIHWGRHVRRPGQYGLLPAGGAGRAQTPNEFDDAHGFLPIGGPGCRNRPKPVEQFAFSVQMFLRLTNEVVDQGGRRATGILQNASNLLEREPQRTEGLFT